MTTVKKLGKDVVVGDRVQLDGKWIRIDAVGAGMIRELHEGKSCSTRMLSWGRHWTHVRCNKEVEVMR